MLANRLCHRIAALARITSMELIGPPNRGFPQLYHYEAFKVDRLRQTIAGKRLYFSNPARFNDPWDCQPHYNADAALDAQLREKLVEQYIRITRSHGAHGAPVPEDEIQQRAQRYRNDPNFLRGKIDEFSADFWGQIDRCWRIYCLSTHPNSELMWAHYAESHKGICLEFASRSPLFFQALKIAIFDMADDDAAQLMVLLTKSKAWEYEDEYRLIAIERSCLTPGAPAPRLISEDNRVELPDGSLKAVILGCLAPETTVSAVKAIIEQAPYPIALKRIIRAPNHYRLIVESAS
jgi:hypothetical protein